MHDIEDLREEKTASKQDGKNLRKFVFKQKLLFIIY